ncbi:MAG TPA: cobalamin-dependent protein, partial [Candidatus Omnitrophota bacterium]|nr:cobalamin-dependent protein [Candidatus Omnitrophota bacterium]
MKIAFVNDCVERLGVEYISAILKNNGHQVQLFVDPQIFNNVYMQINRLSRYFDYSEKIIKDLVTYQPDLIGFSVDTESYQWASRTARRIKAHLRTPIIFGGIHPTSVPERVILNDSVDILCVGEGEYPMLELADSMSRGRMDMSIKNLWFKTNGKIIKN